MLSDGYAEVSDKRRKQLMLAVGRMERVFGGDIDVRTIDWEMRSKYRQELMRLWCVDHTLGRAHYSPPTLQSTKSDQDCITMVLKLAQKMRLIETVPAGLIGGKDKQKKLVIDEKELAAICSQMMLASVKESHPHQPKIYCALSWFEFHTAVRTAEALALEWDHIDWETETMSFYDTKNGETKVLPIFPEVVPLLQEMKALNLPRPFPATGNGYRSAFATARQKAWDAGLLPGINEELLPELTPHIMRHSAITALANTEGATEHMVMALSGHKSPQVARRYMRTNKATMDMLRRLKERQGANRLRPSLTVCRDCAIIPLLDSNSEMSDNLNQGALSDVHVRGRRHARWNCLPPQHDQQQSRGVWLAARTCFLLSRASRRYWPGEWLALGDQSADDRGLYEDNKANLCATDEGIGVAQSNNRDTVQQSDSRPAYDPPTVDRLSNSQPIVGSNTANDPR